MWTKPPLQHNADLVSGYSALSNIAHMVLSHCFEYLENIGFAITMDIHTQMENVSIINIILKRNYI